MLVLTWAKRKNLFAILGFLMPSPGRRRLLGRLAPRLLLPARSRPCDVRRWMRHQPTRNTYSSRASSGVDSGACPFDVRRAGAGARRPRKRAARRLRREHRSRFGPAMRCRSRGGRPDGVRIDAVVLEWAMCAFRASGVRWCIDWRNGRSADAVEEADSFATRASKGRGFTRVVRATGKQRDGGGYSRLSTRL